MTDRLELIHDVHQAGGRMAMEGGALKVKADSLPVDLVARLQNAKPDLVRILSGIHEACPECGGGPVVRDRTFDGYFNRLCLGCGGWLKCVRDTKGNT